MLPLVQTCPSTLTTAPRSEVGKAGEQLREAQSRLRDAEAQVAPLQRRILGLEADKESAAQELAIMREQQVGGGRREGGRAGGVEPLGCGQGLGVRLGEGNQWQAVELGGHAAWPVSSRCWL